VFLEEIKNDLEYSTIAFRTADELEVENEVRHTKQKRGPARVSNSQPRVIDLEVVG
jgi:hypothetical protein